MQQNSDNIKFKNNYYYKLYCTYPVLLTPAIYKIKSVSATPGLVWVEGTVKVKYGLKHELLSANKLLVNLLTLILDCKNYTTTLTTLSLI